MMYIPEGSIGLSSINLESWECGMIELDDSVAVFQDKWRLGPKTTPSGVSLPQLTQQETIAPHALSLMPFLQAFKCTYFYLHPIFYNHI